MTESETPNEAGLLALEDVTFSAGSVSILQPVSLELHRGRMTGVIGPNGSGKSSMVRLVARQQRPTSGAIRLGGRPLADFGEREFARHVAYMPQFTPPAEGMTVRELVALGRFPWHGALGRFSREDAAKVETALERTELDGFADRLVDSLSGGERQRAWLAMMLAQDTACLVLDEPTSALDIAHQADMLALVRDLTRERDLAALIVLHDVNMAARFCDEIIALHSGRMIVRGTPDQVMTSRQLALIYGLEMSVIAHPQTQRPIALPA